MKVIIDIRDGVAPALAIERVASVVRNGRVSGNNDHFCWVTCWDNTRTQVITRQKRTPESADSFIVGTY